MKLQQYFVQKLKLTKALESVASVFDSRHAAAQVADTPVDPSMSSTPASSQPTTAALSSSQDETSDDAMDGHRLTAVYKASGGARPDGGNSRCSSPALSTSRSNSGSTAHHTPARHRPTVHRASPHVDGHSDAGGTRQRVSFQLTEPRSQSSTCIADVVPPPRRRTDVQAVVDHQRTSSADDMRTWPRRGAAERSPRPPRRDARAAPTSYGGNVAAQAAWDSAPTGSQHAQPILDEMTTLSNDSVD